MVAKNSLLFSHPYPASACMRTAVAYRCNCSKNVAFVVLGKVNVRLL